MKHRFTLLLAIALLGAVSCSTGDVATPDEAARVEEFKAHEAALEAQRAQAETPADVAAIESAIEETQAQRAALETSIAERAVGGIIDTIDAFIPIPLQPWKTQLSMLGALLAFRRPRQHLGRGVRSLTRLDGKELGASVLRSVGLLHSSGDPVEVMRGAASAARKRGDEALALKIEEAIAAIQAPPGGVAA